MISRLARHTAISLWLVLPPAVSADEARWPSFRGLGASGLDEGAEVFEKWDVVKGENIAWKTPIPGLGLSCPIIWDDDIYVTTAVSSKGEATLKPGLYGDIKSVNDDSPHEWKVLCIRRADGTIRWERTANKGVPKVKRHPKSSHANSTPATDGEHVVAFFGSEGLYCYTRDGELVWKKDFGLLDAGFYRVPAAQWGFGSSPVIHRGRIVLQCDVQKGGFVAVLDLKTGDEVWRTPRRDVPTWSTPCIYVGEDRSQVILNGYRHIGSYDLKTGAEIWKMTGGGDIPVPTPVIGREQGLVYITNAHGSMRPIYAVRLSARGDISLEKGETSNEYVAWCHTNRGSYMQTPILLGDLLYSCSNRGILGCYDARSGEMKYRERVGTGATGFTASPVACGDRIYLTGENGDVHVLRAGPRFERIALNSLGESCLSTPALAGGRLYFRGRRHLISIGK